MLAAFSQVSVPASAYQTVTPKPSGSPSAEPTAGPNTLPLNSRLAFILDGTISSAKSRADEMVPAHLKEALIVGHHTIANAGTPVQIRILDAKPADNPDIYGFVDIFFEPLRLIDGRTIALRPPTAHLNVNTSAGHESTVAVENTVGDIFTPTMLLHVLRKGKNFVLNPGAEVHALTEAEVQAMPNGTIAIMTPAPIVVEEATPHSSFRVVPLATPNPSYRPQLTPPPLTPGSPTPRP